MKPIGSLLLIVLLAAGILAAHAAPAAPADPATPPAPAAPVPPQVRVDRRSPVVVAVERVKGAVVNISSTRLVKVRYGGFNDDVFDRFFGDSGGIASPFDRTVQSTSLGSGVIIHPAGYVLTNAHVVARATEVTCSLPGHDNLEAKIISADPAQDLAVLKIEPPKPSGGPGSTSGPDRLPYLPMGRSDDLLIGETVIAIGNAMGYSHTVTTGVVSAVERQIKLSDELTLNHLIQTDASINPGNSGGPLLNINGELIGINSAIRGDAQNIGFAIPIDAARKEVAFLLDFERIDELVFGATLDDHDGLKVTAIKPKTPAEQAGLAVGDAVEAVDGKPCGSLLEFDVLMLDSKADQGRRLTVIRKDSTSPAARDITVKLAAAPKPDGNELLWRFFGLKVQPVEAAQADKLGLKHGVGLAVTQLAEDSLARRNGLQAGDILIGLDKLTVNSSDQIGQALKKVVSGDYIRLGFLRGKYLIWIQLKAK